MIVSFLNVNAKLSYDGCRRMVAAIQNGDTMQEIRTRCRIAETWLSKNEVISNEQYNNLMMEVSHIHRETYWIERDR